MSDREFDVIWQAADGYAGGTRPQVVTILYEDVEDCETVEEFKAVVDEIVQEDFLQTVSAEIVNMKDACKWFESED